MHHKDAITLDDVSRQYGGTTVLEHVTAHIPRGRITVLLGANGAGKTTLMRLVSGLARPSSGTVTVAGLPPQSRPGQVGILFEDPHLYPHLTGWQNLRILSGRPADDRLREIVALLGLEDGLLRRRARGYSFGQRRRVTLAGLAHGPSEILLLDEPTNGLDPAGVESFVRAARRMASEGRTLFITGQDMGALSQLAQDVLTLADHRLRPADDWGDGGGGVLELRTQDPDRLCAVLAAQGGPGLEVVRHADHVLVSGDEAALRRLVTWASRQSVDLVRGLSLRDRDLRDVFERMG